MKRFWFCVGFYVSGTNHSPSLLHRSRPRRPRVTTFGGAVRQAPFAVARKEGPQGPRGLRKTPLRCVGVEPQLSPHDAGGRDAVLFISVGG